ncbi:hypothetical protein BIW11_12046 [Tropilaelaps mercedesae]|uniref:Uncharacterized protein n=1 Tax=Tropilaelaps mercedesae TaxID=418985 RepID=A0A1V9X8U3_9ACAR|nr:hypothetical protein BIW11_12046 [Tropilaelaps mercedesae]
MCPVRLCRGRTLAFVLGANLLFVGLLIALTGARAPAGDADSFESSGASSESGGAQGTGSDGSTWSMYRLPRASPTVLKAKYFKLDDGKYCSLLNSDPSRSLIYRRCVCRTGFFGTDCGIPHFFWSQLLYNGTKPMTLTRLQEPRRMIEFKFHGIASPSTLATATPSSITPGMSTVSNNQSNTSSPSLVQNSTVCHNGSTINATLDRFSFHRELPDLQVYTGPNQANFSCATPHITAFSCPNLLCCWNRFWMQASELSFTDLVVLDIGEPSIGPSLPGEVLEFLKFYQGFQEALMIRRGPSVSLVASFNSVAVECNFDIKCITSCESSKFQVISLDL